MKQEMYIRRCFDLARLARGRTSPNPQVGAVLVYQDRIIGEGYHRRAGAAHAEVEALSSVSVSDRSFISQSTLYVSLEPCNVYGRTPPCTELILRERIPRVVIAALDNSPGVDGRGVARLREQGVEVIESVLADEGRRLSAPRNIYVTRQRPYIILKYALTVNGFLARSDGKPLWLTNEYSKRLVHRWRSEIDAIMVGTRTAQLDNPALTTRLYPGPSPIRIIPDRRLHLDPGLRIFNNEAPTWIFTQQPVPQGRENDHTTFIRLPGTDFLPLLLSELYQRQVQTLMVEGGRALLDSLLNAGLWDEARVFTTPHYLQDGLPGPGLPVPAAAAHQLGNDRLHIFYSPSQ